MKKIITTLLLVASFFASAHDEGHGPKLMDNGKKGGTLSPMILASEAHIGSKATLVYKAELVKSSDNTNIKIYVYDKEMKATLKQLAITAKATIISGLGKKSTSEEISLKFVEDHFEGTLPKIKKKPFSIDFKVNEGSKEFLAAFENLD